jgi:hypothetical protein
MSSSPSRDGAFATVIFCSAGYSQVRWVTPPVLGVIVVLVWALAAYAGPDRAVPGVVAVLAAVLAELLVGRRSAWARAEQDL